MQDRIDLALDVQIVVDVDMDESEPRLSDQVGDVVCAAGAEIVQADDLPAGVQIVLAKM